MILFFLRFHEVNKTNAQVAVQVVSVHSFITWD